ncbi:SCO family protein [Pseudoruegeria sp. SK021]|uniref:SCO family protein n=1 Tax=Pseudoruegeria sp. SK021 TaxID=1933035 RepID=UPI000A24729F|nr:SCO family protein [Pseudoruegeria sp. SK021]OSP54617.1 SCO family protein [Pseudoruegeria sp. SK021]
MARFVAISAAVLILCLLGGSLVFVLLPRETDAFASCGSSSGGAIGGPFTLIDSSGQAVTEAEVITEPALIYFGYTFCPDVCPMDMMRNAEAVDILAERGISATPVFITVDPQRDTPEVVGTYAEAMHDRAIGLTGTPAQIKGASQAYKTFFKVQGPESDPYYLVDHSTFTYLVLPEVGFVDVFRRDLTPTQIADRAGCFIKQS